MCFSRSVHAKFDLNFRWIIPLNSEIHPCFLGIKFSLLKAAKKVQEITILTQIYFFFGIFQNKNA